MDFNVILMTESQSVPNIMFIFADVYVTKHETYISKQISKP